jgi:bis(5'-nucleosyl)-tetraphosphatase (symmetrical)
LANYIVGDIQGCLDELHALLNTVEFNAQNDTLWIAGDLVARGPNSLETLRFIYSLGSAAKVVLGNHDLHLLAVSLGIHRAKAKDNTQAILDAPDKHVLLDWLRMQPLMQEHDEFVVCHAGISPDWSLNQARECAREVEAKLQGEQWQTLIEKMYSNQPDKWDPELVGIERWRYAINAFTRMRFCLNDGRLDMTCKLPPEEVKEGSLTPWFLLSSRIPVEKVVLFGHWAALGGYSNADIIGLDTGCVWGGTLTMIRWEDRQFYTQPCLANPQ